jgi:hypothetical protein
MFYLEHGCRFRDVARFQKYRLQIVHPFPNFVSIPPNQVREVYIKPTVYAEATVSLQIKEFHQSSVPRSLESIRVLFSGGG